MTPEQWRQVRQLFDEVLERPADERAAFLDQACHDAAGAGPNFDSIEVKRLVEAMLAAHDIEDGALDQPLIQWSDAGPSESTDADLPGRLGDYESVRRLGRGGMGTVYLGVRADDAYRQNVAIKVLRKGFDTEDLISRFRRERQILASLDHPNIAKLLDGGSTLDGRPFLVMEYVDGVPIDHYCDEHRLSVEQRVQLFAKVCAAVQLAHQKLVVHRDLKPANILVNDAGEPKLLDFGIAKLLDPEEFPELESATRAGSVPMTPEYASPEQVRGEEISTASDVYSLGVVLHLLLSGRGPTREGPGRGTAAASAAPTTAAANTSTSHKMLRPSLLVAHTDGSGQAAAQARGLEPARLARKLSGDLDNIVLMALRLEPDRRYASVARLAQDLEDHLADRPVSARPDTLGYRAAKFVRRHTLAVATSVLAVLFLAGWTVSLDLGRKRLQRQFDRAEAASGFLVDLFEVVDPTRALGESITAREILDRGIEQIDRELASQPQLLADLKEPMARSYKNLGLYDEAAVLLEDVLELRQQLHDGDHGEIAAVVLELAEVAELRGELPSAEDFARRAAAMSQRLDGERSAAHVASLMRLAHVHSEQGRHSDAAVELEHAIDLVRTTDLRHLLASGLDDYAELLAHQGQLAKAEEQSRLALALRRELHGEVHPETALVVNNLALLVKERDTAEALKLLREAEVVQRRIYPDGHPDLALTLGNLGLIYHELGRYDEADELYSEALDIQRRSYRVEHPKLATAVNNLAGLRLDQGRGEEAEKLYRQAVDLRRRVLGNDHPDTAAAINNLGQILASRGTTDQAGAEDEAEDLYREALTISRAHYGPRHVQIAVILSNLARLSTARGDLQEADSQLRESLAILRADLGDDHPRVAMALHNLARVQAAEGDAEGAQASYQEALTILETRFGPQHPDVGRLKVSLAGSKQKTGDSTTAAQLAQQALDILLVDRTDDDPWVRAARRILAQSTAENNAADP